MRLSSVSILVVLCPIPDISFFVSRISNQDQRVPAVRRRSELKEKLRMPAAASNDLVKRICLNTKGNIGTALLRIVGFLWTHDIEL
jgi:hypothetical protein